jgi:hypothetical protein
VVEIDITVQGDDRDLVFGAFGPFHATGLAPGRGVIKQKVKERFSRGRVLPPLRDRRACGVMIPTYIKEPYARSNQSIQ